jgi:hypothetical protein
MFGRYWHYAYYSTCQCIGTLYQANNITLYCRCLRTNWKEQWNSSHLSTVQTVLQMETEKVAGSN